MKTTGWILLCFGILSFFGAAIAGHNVFGPSFWIAVGALLIYKVKEKQENNNRR